MGVATRIGEIAKKEGIALKELSRKANIPYTTLYNAVKRDSKMDLETVQKIASALNMNWYNLYPFDFNPKVGNYFERLAAACDWLDVVQMYEEDDDGEQWDIQKKNQWQKEHFDEAAELYRVKRCDLEKYAPHYADPTEEDIKNVGLYPITFCLQNKEEAQYIEQAFRKLSNLNDKGKRVAIERIEELTQIPKYQLKTETEAPETPPGSADDKEPEAK